MDIQKNFKRLWLWRRNEASGWLEAIGLTLLILLVCNFMNPLNPLFVNGIFPWPWLASLIIVFQYGLGPGLLTVLIITMAALFQKNAGLLTMSDFQAYLLSGITLVLIVAIFSSSWVRKLLNLQTLLDYNDERLKSLSRSFYMLKTSTDYLEQNIITKPATLRMALQELQRLNVDEKNMFSSKVANIFLQIIGQFCSINIAGMYLFKGKKLMDVPIAEIGFVGTLIHEDPLIQKAIETQEMTFVTIEEIEDPRDYNYLMVIPLINNQQNTIGVLAIKEMPFWNLTEETIRVLSILVQYYTKEIVIEEQLKEFLKIYPKCSLDFAKQLFILSSLKNDKEIDSAFAAVLVSKALRSHSVMYNLETKNRTMDSYCVMELENYDALIILMPFTNAVGINGYFTRITSFIEQDLGLEVDNKNIKTRSSLLWKKDAIDNMQYFLDFIEEKT